MSSYEYQTRNIIRLLLGAARPYTLEAIAELVGSSKRSIQNYLGRIEQWIDYNGLTETTLIRRQGSGISLISSPADRKKIEPLLLGGRFHLFSDDFKRRTDIIQLVLLSGGEWSIQKLADVNYSTRPVTIRDLEWISQWFGQFGLTLYKIPKRGVGLAGPESARRSAIAAFFDLFNSPDEVSAQLKPVRGPGRLSDKDREALLKYCVPETIVKIERVISRAETEFDFLMMGDYYVSLVTHLAICISRIVNGNPVSEEFEPPELEWPQLESRTAHYIAKLLESDFHVQMDDRERAYICIHLMGYNAFSTDLGEISIPADVEHLTEALINRMDQLLPGYDFSRDIMLFLGLCMHLKTAVFRLRNDIYLKRRRSALLPDTGFLVHDRVTELAPLYREICSKPPDDEELNCLAQYFLLSSRRNLHKKKALLVCNRSITERVELLTEMETHVASISIVDCCTALQMPYQPDYEYDLIITTENLVDRFDKPVVRLSSVPRDRYMQVISRFIETNFDG